MVRADANELSGDEAPRWLVLDGSALIDPELPLALGELLGRIHVQLTTTDPPQGARSVLAFVELRRGDGYVEVAFEDARDHTTLNRRVEVSGSAALLRETLAHVILGLVEPLVQKARAAAAMPAAPEPEEAPQGRPEEQAPRRRSLPGFVLSLACGGVRVASQTWGARLMVSAGAVFAPRVRPELGLRLGGVIPRTLAESGIEASFGMLSARLYAGLSPFRGRRAALDVQLSAGSDVLSMRPGSADDATHLGHATTRAQPVVGAAFALRAKLTPWLGLLLMFGLDVDLHPRTWVITDDMVESVFFALERLRPYAALGFQFGLSSPEKAGAS